MIMVKILLLLVLAVLPVVPVVLAMPLVSGVLVVGLVGVWMVAPSWGPWLYVGSSLSLIQWRAWQLCVKRLRMSIYVSSPSMGTQNSSSVWLSIGAAIGGIRSFVGGDLTGAVLGGLVAVLLFGLQGILFPNPAMISQACGYPMVSSEELVRLLEKADYPTLLRFNRQARKAGIFGPMLAVELARLLEEKESRGRGRSERNRE